MLMYMGIALLLLQHQYLLYVWMKLLFEKEFLHQTFYFIC